VEGEKSIDFYPAFLYAFRANKLVTQVGEMNVEKFAIVADIHANKYALKVFLEYLDAHFPVSDILNLGDFVQIGPHPKEVTELVLTDRRFINILGNNETALLERDPTSCPEDEFAHQDWTISQLGPDLVGNLGHLSRSNILKIQDKRILMIHSRPYSTTSMPLIYQGKTLDDFVKDYDGMGADYILFGHTHIQTLLSHKGKVFINPGSVGCSKESLVSFCLAEAGEQGISFTFRNIRYDDSKLFNDFTELKVPGTDRILKLFYGREEA
jgi:putative phosphoesterase